MSDYFMCKRADRWLDGWSYGNWRQWICNRPAGGKGQTQCAKVVMLLPFGYAVMRAVGPMNNSSERVTPWDNIT